MHSFLPQTRMRTTGIGYGGIDGAWWLPATTPLLLPSYLRDDLQAIAAAIFLFYDVVTEPYDAPEDTPGATNLHTLLKSNVPPIFHS